ncbi:MAG TPA: cupin domain-containing protein [Solirubrobacteraceae bacterium]|nr:cupin domain-containing protein [Solirubrobacteraceae bacterium]
MSTETERRRFDGTGGPRLIGPGDGERVDLATLGVRFMIWAAESGGGFSLVEHPIPPRGLCAPLHRHTHEDEYSYVLEGRMGAQLGRDVVFAEVGDLVFKPRGQWHTFWNAGDEPCRILEIISPGGFEEFFAELGRGAAPPDAGALFGLEFDLESIPRLCEEHNLIFGMPGE